MPSSQDFGPSTQQFDPASAPEALPSGTRLGGYQIVDVLGRSSFGIIYLALDSSLQRQMAIKEYLPSALATRGEAQQVVLKPAADAQAYANGMAAFLSEAKLLSRFDHPSLARVHSFWEENRSAYMAMPYHDGNTLASTLAALPQPPDEAWLRALLTPLLGALNVLHASQCYHRDISPDNIFLRADGRPVLLNFGASNRVAGDKTLPLSALLNPAYAAIEQYSESATLPQGPWTDLYALAGVLHFAITGRPPIPAPLRATNDPQRALAQAPGLPYSEAFLAGIDKALSVRPRDRPRDAADFQKWLDRAPAAAPTPPVAKARTEPVLDIPSAREEWFTADHAAAPRRRGPLWVAGLCAIALATLGGWWWMQTLPVPVVPIPVTAPPPVVQAPLPASTALAASAVASATVASAPASAPPSAARDAIAAAPPAASGPVAAAASAVPAEEPAPAPPTRKKAAATAAAEADNPRAVCGARANFSLYYCMQTQCKRAKFAAHPQCIELRRRG